MIEGEAAAHSFTFHYVYIYILIALSETLPLHSFTFHYVYIYMNCVLKASVDTKKIYIPLCLYLYSAYATGAEGAILFTFHYVYIYIDIEYMSRLKNKIYIPLCLYLYHRAVRTFCNWMYLHSTMFIFICTILFL